MGGQHVDAMRSLLDPVIERAGKDLGPLRPAVQIAIGAVLTAEVGVVLGYLGQRVLGQYELVLLDEAVRGPARRACCSCSPTSARRCRPSAPTSASS